MIEYNVLGMLSDGDLLSQTEPAWYVWFFWMLYKNF